MKRLLLVFSITLLTSISNLYAPDINITIDDTEYRVVQTFTLGEKRFAEIKSIEDGITYLLGGTKDNPVKYPFSDMEGLDNTALDLGGRAILNDLNNDLRNNSLASVVVPINLALSTCGAGYISYKLYTWAKKLKKKAAVKKRYSQLVTHLKYMKQS